MKNLAAKGILIPLIIAAVAASALFGLCYKFDNKYTAPGDQPINGVLYYDGSGRSEESDALDKTFLIREWEYYGGVLLKPDDFPRTPHRYVSIGEYSHISQGSESKGMATYRLNVMLPEEEQAYRMLIPEIYCAYELYINGEQAGGVGSIDSSNNEAGTQYRDGLEIETVDFTGAGRTEIIFAVESHGYIYGGMTHPIAFGSPSAVSNMETVNFALHVLLCGIALLLALMFVYFRVKAGYSRGVIYSALCILFIGFSCVPLFRTLAEFPLQPLNAVYLLCYYLMFALMWMLFSDFFGLSRKLRYMIAAVCFVISAGAAVVSTVPGLSLVVINAFSNVTDVYKWAMVATLAGVSVYGVYSVKRYSAHMLATVGFFAFALVWDRVFSSFEPVYGLRFPETAGFITVCILGAVLLMDVANAVRENVLYENALARAEAQMEMQRVHYENLNDRIDETRRMHHDMRQHMAAVKGYLDDDDTDSVREFVDGFGRELAEKGKITYTQCTAVDIITGYYSALLADAGVEFDVDYDLPEELPVSDLDVNIILGNLFENAYEAAVRADDTSAFVRVSGKADGNKILFVIENSFGGSIRWKNGDYMSTKGEGHGIGLKSVGVIIEKSGGSVSFSHIESVFAVSVILPFE